MNLVINSSFPFFPKTFEELKFSTTVIKELLSKKVPIHSVFINILITLILSLFILKVDVRVLFKAKNKHRNEIITILIVSHINYLVLEFFSIFTNIISVFIGKFIYNKYLKDILFKDDKNDDSETNYKGRSLLSKNQTSNFTLIDILYVYNYITESQKEKLKKSILYEDPNEIIDSLLSTYTINIEQLKEAKDILEEVKFRGKLISKDEALLILLNGRITKKEEVIK